MPFDNSLTCISRYLPLLRLPLYFVPKAAAASVKSGSDLLNLVQRSGPPPYLQRNHGVCMLTSSLRVPLRSRSARAHCALYAPHTLPHAFAALAFTYITTKPCGKPLHCYIGNFCPVDKSNGKANGGGRIDLGRAGGGDIISEYVRAAWRNQHHQYGRESTYLNGRRVSDNRRGGLDNNNNKI